MPNSDLLRTFVAIAECGNLTLAAGRLNRTQSAVSVQLRNLEEALGVSLFDRTPRGMTLSDGGERLLPAAHRVLKELHQARALFQAPLSGRIRIGIPDDYDDARLELVLARFARRHPGVDVVATSGCTSGFPEAVRRGDLDIAVHSGDAPEKGDLIAVEPTVWAAGSVATIDPEAPVPLAILDRSCWWRDLPTTALDRVGRGYGIAFKSASFGSLKAAIRSGLAVGVIPKHNLGQGMVQLTSEEGFPDLPSARRSILIRDGAPNETTSAMAEAIKAAS